MPPLTPNEKARLVTTVLENVFVPKRPTPKQVEFLLSSEKEVFYGGAAGGGKTYALLMAALQYVHEPKYSALLLRRTYPELSAPPNGLMAIADDWLMGKAEPSDGHKIWTFPSGATLTFGYLENENDKYRYQGSEYQFIGWDELTQFSQSQYEYLFSRLRRAKDNPVPERMRAASNPGGSGHEWVKARFIAKREPDRRYIPAKLQENPHLDQSSYIQNLNNLDAVTRAQYLYGDWDIQAAGNFFKRQWFEIVTDHPKQVRKVRYWDLAASKDGDYTVGALVGENQGVYYLMDIKRIRETPGQVEQVVKQTAMLDGLEVPIIMEQEPGSSGVSAIDHYQRIVLKGYNFRPDRVTGDKATRASPLSSASQAGNVKLISGGWNAHFLDEAVLFPEGEHDDQVDAVSGAVIHLSRPATQMYVHTGKMRA